MTLITLILALWQACVFFASIVHADSIGASATAQSTYPTGGDQPEIFLPRAAPGASSVLLANLTQNGVAKLGPNDSINGQPLFVDASSTDKLTKNNIAVIQCDESVFPGFVTGIKVLQAAVAQSVPAVILYSNTTNFCLLNTTDTNLLGYLIYTMTTPTAWETLRSPAMFSSASGNWLIARKSAEGNSTSGGIGGQGQGYGPSGPSPSTAVAMIILYSITGVITALFLVIIITGAIRAHRHPERYGPRNVLGRPRQSRARGLARAMLDTLPIVKFGEKEEGKPGDVEMASSSAAAGAETREAGDTPAPAGIESTTGTGETDATAGAEVDPKDITAAGAIATQKAHDPSSAASEDNSLGCSICTEDFEKGQDVRVLPCKHSFHPACIDPWLLNVSGTCPLCRIDLRPEAAQNADALNADSALPPPLEGGEMAANSRASRRMSGFWEILNPRRMEQATPQERLDALRRVHEQQAAGISPAEELDSRRRRRMSTRLGERFGIRTRARDVSPSSSPERSGAHGGESHSGSTTQIATIPESPTSPIPAAPSSSSPQEPATAGATR